MIDEKDLMVGDWVLDGTEPAQVTSITCDGIVETTRNERSNIEQLSPIPLTQEILESNGIMMEFRNIDDDTSINRKVRSVYDNWEIQRYGWKMVEVRYVHELQNVLNICGIRREITL